MWMFEMINLVSGNTQEHRYVRKGRELCNYTKNIMFFPPLLVLNILVNVLLSPNSSDVMLQALHDNLVQHNRIYTCFWTLSDLIK